MLCQFSFLPETATYDKYTYLGRILEQVRTRNIREPYLKTPENVILSGIQSRNERGDERSNKWFGKQYRLQY